MIPRTTTFLTLLLALVPSTGLAQEVWTGPEITFNKPAFADHTLPANQDQITPAVHLTRASVAGLFNIAVENSYTTNVSPADTEWATGDIADYASLSYAPWQVWHGSNPPSTVGVQAVVHLISEDIYIPIRFTAWGVGATGGGRVRYDRGTAPGVATDESSFAAVKALYRD